jgi:Spy/CpxP family protein refolding chaperone
MSMVKTLAIASALVLGASQLAFAQAGPTTPGGTTANDAAASGGSGTHKGAMRTGTASSNQKVMKNQNGYRGQQ